MRKFILLVLLFVSFTVFSYKVRFEVYVPENTPKDSKIYISGNFNNWNPEDEKYQLIKAEKYYFLDVELSGTIRFIITRGSTDTSEKIEKYRIARIGKDGIRIIVRVKGWLDMMGKIELIENFYSPELDNRRNIIIYLPPGYDKGNESYPVLYMHDGQNLFDKDTAFVGIEWEIDETLDKLINNGEIKPIIVVGIYNNADRLSEYSPWYDPNYQQGGKGDKYIEFIVKTLKPFIDKHYRTNEKINYIGGSSMGGLISLYAVTKYSIFSGAIVMSPAFFFGGDKIFECVKNNPPTYAKIYLDVGGNETNNLKFVKDVEKMYELLKQKNVKVKYIFDSEGKHNEAYWARRFPAAIKWILEDVK
ncbi:MAG: alpha/beta hydrolase [Thermosipho sp. (in: Bacteria)]|nr:alpha/beta hydrolase [Thermosipho sp. (in: thermotogales)]